jgi:hypothetical protein
MTTLATQFAALERLSKEAIMDTVDETLWLAFRHRFVAECQLDVAQSMGAPRGPNRASAMVCLEDIVGHEDMPRHGIERLTHYLTTQGCSWAFERLLDRDDTDALACIIHVSWPAE